MANTIGKIIGKVVHNFSVESNSGQSVQLRVWVDFSNAFDNEIKQWALSNRIIAMQRPLRSLSVSELTALNDSTFIAGDCGKKVVSREEKIKQLTNAGIPMKLAVLAIDNPELLETVEVPEDESEKSE